MSGYGRKGKLNGNWRGGRSVASNGYILVRVGIGHHLADVRGYAYEHRVVAEEKIGRRLEPGEQVHHRDGNKQNNTHENLEVLSAAEHQAEHRNRDDLRLPGAPNPVIACACGCGQKFKKYDTENRPRKFVSGHNPQVAPTVQAVLSELSTGPAHRESLARRIGSTTKAVATCLSKLRQRGLVRPVGRGVWSAHV